MVQKAVRNQQRKGLSWSVALNLRASQWRLSKWLYDVLGRAILGEGGCKLLRCCSCAWCSICLHIRSKVPTSSPNDFPRTQGHHQGSASVTESITSQFQQVLDAFFFMGHWPPLIPLMWNKATPSLVPPGDWRGPQGKWHKIFPALAFSDRKLFSKNEL